MLSALAEDAGPIQAPIGWLTTPDPEGLVFLLTSVDSCTHILHVLMLGHIYCHI